MLETSDVMWSMGGGDVGITTEVVVERAGDRMGCVWDLGVDVSVFVVGAESTAPAVSRLQQVPPGEVPWQRRLVSSVHVSVEVGRGGGVDSTAPLTFLIPINLSESKYTHTDGSDSR